MVVPPSHYTVECRLRELSAAIAFAKGEEVAGA